ncbi:MarR family transcriptional regulator [Granulosicoccaceae sp. 1_MG-2023]|nr:MarR family transcriptional regulator [Granulosicoccaceae sp. 1_MG-2023]
MPNDNLFAHIAELFHAGKTALSREFQDAGLCYPPAFLKVTRLIDHIQPCTAQTIVQTLQRDKAQITRLLNDMEKQGLIKREPNPEDRRSQLLSLSEKGKEDLARMQAIEQQMMGKMMQGISDDERARLSRTLLQIRRNLS